MEASSTQPKRIRRRQLILVWSLPAALVVFFCLLIVVWPLRRATVSFVARRILATQGFPDADFQLTRLSPGCVAVSHMRLGGNDPVLEVDCAEALFSIAELRRGQLSRLRVRGVRIPVVVQGSRLVFPLQKRLESLMSAREDRGAAPSSVRAGGKLEAAVGELSAYDVQVPVRLPGGAEVITLRGNVSLVSEPSSGSSGAQPERYRVWASLSDAGDLQASLSGTLAPQTGALTLSSDVKVKSVENILERVRLVAPGEVAHLRCSPTNCTFALRGSLSVSDWTNAGPFEVTAELGRGSALILKEPDGLIRFQTFRVEASGTPADVQSRLSVGIAGFRIGGQVQASQEEGRLVSMRGNARFRRTATNLVVRATLDSDLPGKSVAQVLPKVLPLLPRLLTEGGTFHAEAELDQPREGAWQGRVRYAAEARRNSLTLPAGRVGAGRVAIEGLLNVGDAALGVLNTDIRVEDGYFFRQGLSVRGEGVMSLSALPPYRSASGTFEGRFNETIALPNGGVDLPADGVRFCGNAAVERLASNPVWTVALDVPGVTVGQRNAKASCHAALGASAQIRYCATQFSVEGDVWARDAAMTVANSGAVGRVEGGLGQVAAHFGVVDGSPADLSNVTVRAVLEVSNGWCRAGERLTLEGGEARVPFELSLSRGITFGRDPRLAWKRLEADGVCVLPGALSLRTEGGFADADFGVGVDGSRLRVLAQAHVPLSDPRRSTIDLAVPEAELIEDDALVARIRQLDAGVTASGRLSAEARVRFLGNQPHALGRVRVAGGKISRDRLEIEGLAADVAFEAGLGFRTIERPAVTFTSAKAGNIRLDKGRVGFQVTPEEVFVDRFEVGWCKGSLNAYSVHLDPKNPKADVVVYADRIDLGEALMMVMPFKGRMEGVLYGRFPVGIDGNRVKLSTGYLYSLPGQGGVLRLEDSTQMMSVLSRAGIMGDVQQPLSKALSDMDFSAIRMELEPKTEGDSVFRIKLDGKSNFKEWPAPVALNLNLHGPLEELLNLGLSVSRK